MKRLEAFEGQNVDSLLEYALVQIQRLMKAHTTRLSHLRMGAAILGLIQGRVTRCGDFSPKFWPFLGKNGDNFELLLSFFKHILAIFDIFKHFRGILYFLAFFDNFWLFLKNHIWSLWIQDT